MAFKSFFLVIGMFLIINAVAFGQMSFSDGDLERYSKDDQRFERGTDSPENEELPEQKSDTIIRRGKSGVYDGDYSKTSDDKDVWCQRGEQARSEIVKTRDDAAAAKEHFYLINEQFQGGRTKTRYKEVVDAKTDMEKAFTVADQAKKALDRLEDEAHRKGVHPGWLKCNFN